MIQNQADHSPWYEASLQEVASFLDGQRRPIKSTDRAKMQGVYPYYGATGIIDYVDDYLFDEELVLLGEDGENILSRNLPQAFVVNGKVWVNNHAHVLKPKSNTTAVFLSLALERLDFSPLNSGSAQPKLTKGTCLSIRLPFPPTLEEQKAIAQALSDMDELIASLDALIAKKRDIKQGAMQQLLTGKTRLSGFSSEWESRELRSLCELKSGAGITSATISSDDRYPVYGANGLRGFTKTKTHSGTFPLIGRVGALCGNIQVASGDFFASEHAIIATANDGVDPHWLALALGTLGLNRLSEASAQPVLTVSKLKILTLLAPIDEEEQVAISQMILTMQNEVHALEAKKKKLTGIRQGMMQQLLTGRIRLV